jgi:hypothetical protein
VNARRITVNDPDAFIRGQEPPRGVELDWPTLIGGPLDGNRFEAQADLPALQFTPGVEDGPVAFERDVTYNKHRLTFAAGGHGVVVVTCFAWREMSAEVACWELLCRGLGVPEALR